MFAQLLRQLRLAKGLTLEQVAVQLGVTRASVSKWEGGHSRPEHNRLQAIAQLFQVSPAYLLGLASASPPKELTVVELQHGTDIGTLLNYYCDRRSYPTTLDVGDDAFFVDLQDDSLAGLGAMSVLPGTLMLVDPSTPARSGDLVLASRGPGNYCFMGLNVLEGENQMSYLGKKYANMRPVRAAKVVGVVLQAVHVTPMRGFVHRVIY